MSNNSDEEKMRIEARKILDSFAKSLEEIDLEEGKTQKRVVGGFREEGEGSKGDKDPKNTSSLSRKLPKEEEVSDFRERMFKNAPKKEGDFILAEKKKW
jgi:Asp-tRNA(Asn)/Glu-tRNA(Gln) amidotransferase C subunit